MKTNSLHPLLAIAAIGATALLAYAASGAPDFVPAKPVTTFAEAKKAGPNDTVTMQCKGCKTVMIRDSKRVGPPNQGQQEWFTVGSKHTCSECKGEITVVKGKTTDSMQLNCGKCGEGTVTCCVAPAAGTKK